VPSFLKLKDRFFYGWVVVSAFFIVGTTLAGVQLSFGIFFKSIEAEFGLTRAVTSLVLSISMLIGSAFRVLGGLALDRYGPKIVLFAMGLFTGLSLLLTSQTGAVWQLFITYSLILPIGTSATYAVSMSTISRWFDKKRGLALGVAGAGPGLGMIIMAPFATFLITQYDWRFAYLVIGLIAWLTIIPVSALLKRDPYEIGALPDGVKPEQASESKTLENRDQQTGLSLPQSLRTVSFWLFIFIWICFGFTILFVLTHLVPHTTDIGFSAAEAAAVLSVIGVATLLGRVFLGILSDKIGRKASLILCSVIRAAAMLSLIWAQEMWMLYLFALAYGFTTGGFSPIMAALISETFGLRKIGALIGALDIGFGVGAAIGPAVGGLIFDLSTSYSLAFIIGFLAMLLAILLIALVRPETDRNLSST